MRCPCERTTVAPGVTRRCVFVVAGLLVTGRADLSLVRCFYRAALSSRHRHCQPHE